MCAGCAADGHKGSGLDLTADYHAHTAFAAGRDTVGVVVTAAERAGLTQLVIADQAGAGTSWLPAYQSAVQRAQLRTDLRLRVAIETEVLRPDGWLDLPGDLAGLEAVSVSVSRVPLPDGPVAVDEARGLLLSGALHPGEVAELVVAASAAAVERASRYAPTQLARPLCLLGQLGLDMDEVDGGLLDQLAAACRSTGTVVEVSEAWRTPTPQVAYRFAAAGVHLVAASDSADATRVGSWEYMVRLRTALERARAQVPE